MEKGAFLLKTFDHLCDLYQNCQHYKGGNGHFEHLQAPEKFERVPIRVTVVVYAYALFSKCYATIRRCDLLFDIVMGKHRKKHKSERERYVLVLIVSDDHHEVTGRTLPPRLEGVSLSGRRTTRFVLS